MWRDDAYVLDMLLAARKTLEFARGVVEKDIPRLVEVLEPLVPQDEGEGLFGDAPE